MNRIFLVKEPKDCEPINSYCDSLDRKDIDYEVTYDDECSESNNFGIVVLISW